MGEANPEEIQSTARVLVGPVLGTDEPDGNQTIRMTNPTGPLPARVPAPAALKQAEFSHGIALGDQFRHRGLDSGPREVAELQALHNVPAAA